MIVYSLFVGLCSDPDDPNDPDHADWFVYSAVAVVVSSRGLLWSPTSLHLVTRLTITQHPFYLRTSGFPPAVFVSA